MWIAYEFWKFRDWYHAVVYENADFLFRFQLSGKRNDCVDGIFIIVQHYFPGIIYKKLKRKGSEDMKQILIVEDDSF